ncbi:SGNH/GDSL hydrolase family protein [Nocardioides donggukensis]|uniref:SGNH/GDSL hydrolase family protein n=1 Tax=Nocardioides donggukensis TaxID=2774019 RepID=A0A927K5T0_9ACTN|nr:SGNH/GDSL hydrolase family protein [Nocardioides donggukensis]MBD8870456.1 SGNH/GDSL hydrolase family protein [Nocardioides donggukensis]
MGKAAAARRLAATAAYGGGGLSVLGAGLYGVLTAEARLARKAIGEPGDRKPPDATGWYGRGRPGPAYTMALLGDSSAAGYGVERVEDTPGAVLASGLAERADRRVYLKEFAVVGAQSSALATQVEKALPVEPDIAVILIGANDVTHTVLPAASVRFLAEAVRRLRDAGVEVVVGTCPDLGTIKPIAPPLRQVARAWSRRLATAQAITVVEAGGRTVSLGSILGPEFAAAPALLFGPDRFHPSAEGYASLGAVMLPSILAALGVIPDEEATPEALRGEGVLPIARAAVEAARTPGTELGGAEVAGAPRGVRGLWVELRHRRRGPRTESEAPDHAEAPDPA